MRNECDCSKYCYNNFSERKILDHVLNLREMERNEKEMYIMGTIGKVTASVRCKDGERKRTRWEYAYEGKKVCRNAFLLIFDIGKRTVEGLLKHMNEQGVVPRVHGLTGKFLVNYAAEEGLPQPAPSRGRDGIPSVYLPALNTKLSIHKEYVTACVQNDKRSVGLTTFKDVWNRCVPHIKIMSPREDVCKKCEDFRQEISLARNEDDKLSATGKYHQHVLDARSERAVYEQCVNESTEMFQQQLSVRNYNTVHYTFDFSQFLKLPHHSREKGPTFFIQPRKIQLFGFRIDGYRQYNYLLHENQTIGQDGQLAHGPDSVISMLDDAFEKFDMKEDECRIHADNSLPIYPKKRPRNCL
ncbi:uncharacterized protein LOC123547720 [Mercenaria mercenaria]|uniref:uncharacterized protein LOC123547720 n=1 Tax=Mercenaria mercenaria TaxID=6596 RepID=UPI00234E9EF6|nr:uncharacterized protein LOC123547720 [Mercenaria mercenaria]